jgi:hypothetical protein
MIPPSTARSSIQGRPPLGWGRLGGSKGWMAAQTSSGIRCSAMDGVVLAAHHPRPSLSCETTSIGSLLRLG